MKNDSANATKKQDDLEEAQYESSVQKAKKLEDLFLKKINEYPAGFCLIDGKIFYERTSKKEDSEPSLQYVCSELRVRAHVRDYKSHNHGRLVCFPDSEGIMHELVIPAELFAGDSMAVRALLLNQGMRISNHRNARQLLADLILESSPNQTLYCTEQVGWHHNAFVFPSETIGEPGRDNICFLNSVACSNRFSATGSVQSWRANVAKYCSGNSRLMFGVNTAFAAPLLYLTNIESGGVNIKGTSSIGKTTLLKVASSVWGSPKNLPTWRSTANGLEAVATEYNDCLLCLDELSQVEPEEAGKIAYMLANGMGKLRANCRSASQTTRQWRILFISTGEIGLALQMRKTGKRAFAGQEVRISEIPADTGKYGIFEYLHDFENGADFSNYLNQACCENHGVAIREFIKQICIDKNAVFFIQSKIEEYQKALLSKSKRGQVVRTARRFALIAAAGELATQYGITGWDEGESFAAVQTCFNDWLLGYGERDKESDYILETVKTFFLKHAESRFKQWDCDSDQMNEKVHNRAGFKRKQADGGWEFYVFKNVFRNEICWDFDYRYAEQLCIEYGLIMPDSQGRTARSEYLPGNEKKKTTRVYRFTSKVLED